MKDIILGTFAEVILIPKWPRTRAIFVSGTWIYKNEVVWQFMI